MNLNQLVKRCNGVWLQEETNIEINNLSKDTRTICKGDLYIPIIGESFDGHRFIDQAFEKGAAASLTSRKDIQANGPLIYVEDTVQALADMARSLIDEVNVPVVGVTGSVGKTSTRDLVGAVVASAYNTLKTEGNYNNEIGLPLTVLSYTNQEAMVLEMGMSFAGEIRHLTKIAKPFIGVITNVGTAHIGNLGSRENILKAKLEITEGLRENGILVINNDNDMLHHYYESVKDTQLPYQIKTIGVDTASDYMPENVVLNDNGSSFDYKGVHFIVPVPGIHFVYNALSGIAVGEALNIPLEKIQGAIANFSLTKKRMDFIELKDGIRLIDGTYNASLDSMKSSLSVLGLAKGRKIAVLADMLELGEFSSDLHFQTGKAVSENNIDVLVCVGNESKATIQGANDTKEKYWFETNQEAIDFLKDFVKENDTILLKGANGMNLKQVVESLKEIFKNG